MRTTYGLFVLLFVLACQPPEQNKVEYRGSLKSIMHEGNTAAVIDLDSLKNVHQLYALGAVENLKGEILIWNSSPLTATVSGDTLVIDSSFTPKAALLVFASVPQWKEIPLPDEIHAYGELENYLKEKTNRAEPFPFLLVGETDTIQWHVINQKSEEVLLQHDQHVQSGLRGTLTHAAVNMLGFYSAFHQGIFTHHTSNMHLHVQTPDRKLSAHVDDLKLNGRAKLFLPE